MITINRAALVFAMLVIATSAFGEDPEYYVKKDTWQETLQASREAVLVYLSNPATMKEVVEPEYGPWFQLGPYSSENTFEEAFLPEKEIDLATGDGERKWKQLEVKDGLVHHTAIDANSAVYLYRTISAERPMTVPSYYATDDSMAVWLNGKKLISHDGSSAPGSPHHFFVLKKMKKARLELKKGENQLLIKIANVAGNQSAWYFCTSIKSGPEQYQGQAMVEAMRDEIWELIQRDFTGAEAREQIARAISIDDMVEKTLLITGKEKVRLARLEKEGILTIRPVALPTGEHLVGDNYHLGWPVGVKVGKTLLCLYHQTLHHHGTGPRQNETSSRAVLVRSTDNGETWSAPIDMRQFGTSDKKRVIGFGGCFAVLDDTVFLATIFGLYRSKDEGKTWEFLPDALTQEQTGHEGCSNFGPRMTIHPEKGLVVAAGENLYYSKDKGVTWKHQSVSYQTDNWRIAEPTAIYHDGHLVYVSRCVSPGPPGQPRWHRFLHGPERPGMLVFGDNGWPPLTHQKRTNISSFRGPDTTDLDFNPVTDRFEAVVANRSGGAVENEKNQEHESTVNLWSMSKEDVYAGRADKWRFEGTLLRVRSGRMRTFPYQPDGYHPGGGIMDKENGVQHIFVYCGPFSTPTGIYRITRTLDTEKFRKALSRLQTPEKE